MVPMHPGLKNGPFMPHNLIPVQGSPVSLLKFQVVPRFKLVISFGSKKKEPRYTCLRAAKPAHSQNVGRGFILCPTPPTEGTIG